MSRIKTVFATLRQQQRTALIPYLTAGDPDPRYTVDFMHTLAASGADIIELGVPFSDPMADGPVIQAACERALKHHVNLKQVLAMVTEFRQQNVATPIVLMGYLNPVEIMGYQQFAQQAALAGVDGLLTVDLPPEEAQPLLQALTAVNIDPVFLLSPTSTQQRIQMICQQAAGFVYYVSLKGVTGAANLNLAEIAEKLAIIRQHTELPVGVGFGIKDAATAVQVAAYADAVIVGSALVKLIAELTDDSEQIKRSLSDLLQTMRIALDSRG